MDDLNKERKLIIKGIIKLEAKFEKVKILKKVIDIIGKSVF